MPGQVGPGGTGGSGSSGFSGYSGYSGTASGIVVADTRVLFADGANTPAGDAGLTYNKTTDTLTAASAVVAGNAVVKNFLGAPYAGFGNAAAADTAYAVSAGEAGDTYVNAGGGQAVNFRIANVDKWRINSAGNFVANGGTLVKTPTVELTPVAFASLPVGAEGMMAWVNNSTTETWGATIAGGGAFKVLAVFNGTNWTVAGK